MVKLEEVPDEDLFGEQAGPHSGEDDWDDASSTTSDASSDVSSVAPEETLFERLAALQDMVPPTQRRFLASSYGSMTSWVSTGLRVSAKCLWIASTSALLVGVPFALALGDEQQVIEMEREMKMQQSANELLTPGSSTQTLQQQAARPAL